MSKYALAIAFIACLAGGSAQAARCGGDFNSFVASMASEAQAAGVSASVTSAALSGVQQDGAVLAFDRRQRYTFNKSFEQYVSTRVGPGRINGGKALLQRHAALLSRIEQQFGVPRYILVAIWGWRAISARATSASCRWSARWRRSRMTAAAPSYSRASCSRR